MNNLIRVSFTSRRNASSARSRRRRSFLGWAEGLEDRQLLTLTDVSQVALALGKVHYGTNLYINFDGGSAPYDTKGDTYTVRAFETEAGDTKLNRDQDIQDILFQVAEVFSPFDVQVHRIYGAGNYSTNTGDTTIFVGENSNDIVRNGDGSYSQNLAGFTPPAFADDERLNHTINSDPYDIAFVDPTSGTGKDLASLQAATRTETDSSVGGARANIFDISRGIAHEAGHTFGLAHIRSDGRSDPAAPGAGSVDDVMAYDAPNEYFADQSLNLTTANQGASGVQFNLTLPQYHDAATNTNVTLSTQNSYLALGSLLGYRSNYNEHAGLVADPDRVIPGLRSNLIGPDISAGTSFDNTLGRLGDYHVYTFTPESSGVFHYDTITVQATSGGLQPEILVYDQTGTSRVAVAFPSNGKAVVTNLKAGLTYQIVVGAVDGNSTGNYNLTIDHIDLTKYLQLIQSQEELQRLLEQIAASGSGLSDSTGSIVRDAQLSAPIAQEVSPGAALVDPSLGQISETNHVQQIPDIVATPPTIVKEQVIFTQKRNKKNKPVGKPVISGFSFQYSGSMGRTARVAGNYEVEYLVKAAKRNKAPVYRSINFAVSYDDSSNTVTLATNVPQKEFAKGGEITIVGVSPDGVSSTLGALLNEGKNAAFIIEPNAKGFVAD
jgi:hypothetical protein